MKLRSIGNLLDKEAFVSSIGGTITGFVCDGIDIIYPQKMIGTKLRGGIPICFPFFGSPKARFAKEIPQHGWLRNEELKLIGKSPFTLIFQGKSQNRKVYPWHLVYQVVTSLTADALQLKLKVQRLEDGIIEDAPVNPAFHPYFNNLGRRAVRIGSKEISDFGEAKIIPIENKVLFVDLGKKTIEILLGNDFGENTHVALWSDSNEYFCIEPILNYPDDFDTSRGRHLKQGESLILSCAIAIQT